MHIFISYCRIDYPKAKKIYNDLNKIGLSVWMDKENLLPGQNWDKEIKSAIREADFIILLLSNNLLVCLFWGTDTKIYSNLDITR